MNDLSIAQEYLICAVNPKGKISGFNTERLVCLVASCLLELQLENCIKIDKKYITVTDRLPQNKMYLKPLYDFLNQPKPVKIEKILETYTYSVTDKNLNELISSIGTSLKDLGLVKTAITGIFKNKTAYMPSEKAIHFVVDMVRAEFFEDVEVTEDIAALVILLDKSNVIKTYFSEYERKEIKKKLKEAANSETGKLIESMIEYIENMISIMTVLHVFYS